LDGVRVIEVGQALAGPLAGVLLADMGADVIKIEKPDGGDDARIWGPPYGPDGETSLYFYSQNRNKRSVVARPQARRRRRDAAPALRDRRHPDPEPAARRGRRDRHRPEAMLARHPRLIYCSIWAFGYQGPAQMKPGFDPLLQAYGGMMSVTGRPEDPPTFCGASINDKATGMFCTIGALAALRQRDKTGKGCLVDTSLFDSAVHWVEGQVNSYVATAMPQRHGTGGNVIVPYQTFDCADGWRSAWRPATTGCGRAARLVLGHPEWATDPEYAKCGSRVANKTELLPHDRRGDEEEGRGAEWIEASRRPACRARRSTNRRARPNAALFAASGLNAAVFFFFSFCSFGLLPDGDPKGSALWPITSTTAVRPTSARLGAHRSASNTEEVLEIPLTHGSTPLQWRSRV
jgi:crotonobetainyl-CoA:carnitine CoA-transferase CaiB-like acyl-CoA transferase